MKKTLSLILCLALILSCLASVGAAETLPEDDLSRHVDFSYWMYADDYKIYNSLDENPVVQYLNKKFNVTIEFQTPAMGSEADNFQTMLGTQDYTDVMNMTYCTESLNTLYNDGVILDLAPYLEQYMPNYYALLQKNAELRRMAYDDEGHMFSLYTVEDINRNQWGGLVYRRDIVDAMTGGNPQFPSGNDEPTTVEDWDYMLPLMKQYFEYSGMPDTACLILPAIGYTATGEIQAGWGATGIFGLSADGKTVEFGPATEYFYNYVAKMHEWYEKGYIYQDFASRTNDLFYLPNTSLTYGGAAGAWFGILQQLSDYMNISGDGWKLEFDVRAAAGPLDTEHGITPELAGARVTIDQGSSPRCIAAAVADEPEKLVRILTVMDYLYSKEGSEIADRGLTPELAKDDPIYQRVGLEDGAWWYDEDGNYMVNPKTLEPGWPDYGMSLNGQRINGGTDESKPRPVNKPRTYHDDAEDEGARVWTQYPATRVFSTTAISMNEKETEQANKYFGRLNDYVNSMIPKFILGTEELTPESWQKYLDMLNQLGLQEVLEARQSSYDRYLSR